MATDHYIADSFTLPAIPSPTLEQPLLNSATTATTATTATATTATATTTNRQGLQASIHHENDTNNATVANAKTRAIEAAYRLADLAIKTDPKIAYNALNELVISLAY